MLNGKPSTSDYHASNGVMRDMHSQKMAQEFTARVETAQFVNAVYERRFSEYVLERLKAQYHPDTYAQLKVDVRTNVNVLADVVSKLAVAWAEGATYSLSDDTGEYQDEDRAFADFLAAADMDNLARKVDILTELHPRVAVGPCVREQERSGRRVFGWAVHDPSTFNLIPSDDDPTDFCELDTYGWTEVDDVMRQCKIAWRSDVYRKFVLSSRQQWDLVEEEENPYGVIPFVLFGNNKPVSSPWLQCVGEELADISVSVCCAETLLANQSLAQIKVLAGEFKDFPRGQVLRHCGVVNTGDAQSLNILDYQTDVTRFADTFVQRPRRNALASVGLPLDEFDGTSTAPSSGEALKMRYSARDRRAIHKRPFLKAAMSELFWLSQHVLSVKLAEQPEEPGDSTEIVGISTTVPYDPTTMTSPLRLSIDVHEITYPELADERVKVEDRDLALGLTNVAELYMRRNPDATREEAIKAVVANRALNVRLQDNGAMRRIGPALLRAEDGAQVEQAVLAR